MKYGVSSLVKPIKLLSFFAHSKHKNVITPEEKNEEQKQINYVIMGPVGLEYKP